ncbi:MAG: glycine cleavage system transcriptional repressor [Acidimicrobiales bacterium]
MAEVAVSAVGVDRPGIVAGVTQVLLGASCNIEDSSMTILRGHFAMMLVVRTPLGLEPSELEVDLAGVARELDLVVSVRQVVDTGELVTAGAETEERGKGPEAQWTVAVHGGDHPGIVAGVSKCLAGLGVNILGLQTRLIGEASSPVYVMTLDVALPPGLEPEDLRRALEARAGDMGVTCTMHPSEADVF